MNTAMHSSRVFSLSGALLSFLCLFALTSASGCISPGPAPRLLQLNPALPSPASLPKAAKRGQVVVAMPVTENVFDTDAIALLFHDREIRYLAGSRWTTTVPRLVQRGVIDGLEASGSFPGVSDESAGINATVKVLSEVRAFQLRYENEISPPTAEFTLSVRLLHLGTGNIIASRTFQIAAPASGTDALALASACETALTKGLAEIVPWVAANTPGAGRLR